MSSSDRGPPIRGRAGGHLSRGLWQIGAILILQAVLAAGVPASEQSSVPTEGADILVNLPGGTPGEDEEAAPNCNTQNEVSLARFENNLVAGWNDFAQCDRVVAWRDSGTGGYPLGNFSLNGYGYSSDGGQTWSDGGLLTQPVGGHLQGDPVLAAGPDGTFYYAVLMTIEGVSRVGVSRSTDGGRTWSIPANASLNASPNRDPRYFQDKPWIAVDVTDSSHRGNVYVAWTELGIPPEDPLLAPDHSVLFARSADGGRTFEEPVKLSTIPSFLGGFGTQVAVGPGGQIYVGWIDFNSSRVSLARSLDGGATFSPQKFILNLIGIGDRQSACVPGRVGDRFVLNGDIRVENWPAMAVDTSGSSDPASLDYNPYRGRIYLAVPHDSSPDSTTGFLEDESDIAFIYSSDGGTTWKNVSGSRSPQFILSNPDPSQNDQFHPQVAVDSEGRVGVSWYDRRVSRPTLENWDMAVFATVSTDGGETFGPNFQVGDVPFPPSRTNPNTNLLGGCYMGEYNGMAGGDGEFLLAWGDNRDGPDEFPDPNVYFDRITLHDPLATDDSATTANGIPVTINVLRNDSDPNGDPLTVTGVTQPAHGTTEINPDDTVTYDPVCGFQGIDTFSYTISDGQGGSDTGLVSVRARRTTRPTTIGC